MSEEKGKRYVYVPGQGFVEKKAGPELLPPDLRKLPSEHVTKNWEEPNKVHALDPDYIRDNILEDLQAAPEPETPEEKRAKLKHATRFLTQEGIDVVRARVILTLIREAERYSQRGEEWETFLDVKHLWFPENNIEIYELRQGNPPAGVDRPKHLRKFALAIDPLDWPRRVAKILNEVGFQCPTKAQYERWKADYELCAASEFNELRSVPTEH